MIDLARCFAHIRGGPLPGRLGIGVLSAAIGAVAFHAIGGLTYNCHASAAFYPLVQIAGLTGGLAAAGVAALASTLIVHFSAEPFGAFCWTDALLLFANAALAGLAGESLRRATRESRRTDETGEARDGARFESVAATIAHDIAQPLSAAAAYLQTVRRLRAIETDARGASIVAIVDKASAQLARAGRLLMHMREFLAHGPPRLAAVPLHALLRETIRMHHGDDGPLLLRLDARCDRVLADPAQLEQLFVELLRDIRPPQGQPAISTVSDAAAVTMVFALGDIDADAPDGRAADLSLWRAIVESHRGAFRSETMEQGGLSVEFTLPLAARGG